MLPATVCRPYAGRVKTLFRKCFLAVAGAALLTACSEQANRLDKVDPILNLGRSDYQDLRKEGVAEPPIPKMQLRLSEPHKSQQLNNKLVSISVTEKIPLKDVLMELASKADVNLELDPRITGGVIFTANQQPFSRVMDRLCNMAGLRYSVEDSFLRVELDEPYIKTYPIDYLTLVRKAQGEIGIATNVFAAVDGTGTGRTNTSNTQNAANGNNSTTRVETATTTDFWAEVEGNVESIMTNTRTTRSLRALDGEVKTQLQQAGLSPAKPFTMNKQAGLLTIFGSERQHAAIDKYVLKLKRNINSQVLIEARIIEVELNEEYKGGINWRSLSGGAFDVAARFGPAAAGAPFATAVSATDGVVTLSLNDSDFGGIVNFVRSFGTTRTLSSPRLTVLNNQPAVLKVARNEVYFTSTIENTPIVSLVGGVPVSVSRTVNSTPNTVPVGFLMTVQPAINLEKGEVTLNMRPTVSFIVDRVEDPGIKIAAADANVPQVTSSIPVVAVREMDSVLTLPSGSVAVMGGLMQDSAGNLESGVPFADELPLVGNLAKSRASNAKITELVILLRATIINRVPEPDQADAELYKKYSRDRRPLPMRYEPDDAAQYNPSDDSMVMTAEPVLLAAEANETITATNDAGTKTVAPKKKIQKTSVKKKKAKKKRARKH